MVVEGGKELAYVFLLDAFASIDYLGDQVPNLPSGPHFLISL